MDPNFHVNATFQVPTMNRYDALGGVTNNGNNGVGPSAGNPGTVQNACSTNSHLSTDEKLSLLINKIDTIESNQRQIMSIAARQNAIEGTVFSMKQQISKSNSALKQLAYHSIDIEARSRRNNLIFYGLAEFDHEDTYNLLRNFFSDHLGLDIDDYYIHRLHRLGSFRVARSQTQTPRRPIIVAFRDFRDTEHILSLATKLKGTRFGIDRDYPKEISAARKRLWGRFKEEKANPRSKVKLVYPAKLLVNNIVVADEFPDWGEVMSADRCEMFREPVADNLSAYSKSTQLDTRGSLSSISSNRTMSVSVGDVTGRDEGLSNAEQLQSPPPSLDQQATMFSQFSQQSQSILREARFSAPSHSNSGASFSSGVDVNSVRTGLTSTPMPNSGDHGLASNSCASQAHYASD